MQSVLVTGGAGFVGSFLVDALAQRGWNVRVLDNLAEQVHQGEGPSYVNRDVEFIRGDVRNAEIVRTALDGVDAVFHLAAAVGVGQSMYQIQHYTAANSLGTAVLLEELVNRRHLIRKLVVASSMSIYGEGAYECIECGPVFPRHRGTDQLDRREWELICPECQCRNLLPIPTSESKPLNPTSVYAVSKRDQEDLCLAVGSAYRLPTVALRFFNIYGPHQALSNPYTGVAAIFSSRLINGSPPVIFEDGGQRRDFIHVRDIVRACLLALDSNRGDYQALNVGTGRALSVLDIARVLTDYLNPSIEPTIVGRYRAGDIRHCYSDISRIQTAYGFVPEIKFEDGILDLVQWVKEQQASDNVEDAMRELTSRGLA